MASQNYLLFKKAYKKYSELGSKYKNKMNHLADEMLVADFKLNSKLLHLRDKMLVAELEINDKLLQLQGEENDNE